MATSDDGTEFAKKHQVRITKDRLRKFHEIKNERDRLRLRDDLREVEIANLKRELDRERAEKEILKLDLGQAQENVRLLTTERNIYKSWAESRHYQPPPPPVAPSTYPDGTPTVWHRPSQKDIFGN